MDELLREWLTEEKIDFLYKEKFIQIIGQGIYYLLKYKEKVINKDFLLEITDEEWEEIYDCEANFVIFRFGGQYYYSAINKEKETWKVPVKFEDLRHIGKAKQDFDYDFVNLGVHSEYELLNGSRNMKSWAKKALFLNHIGLGICDKNTLAGIVAFQMECEEKKLKFVIGETITVLYDKLTENETYELKLYVKNEEGWKNLLMINKAINIDNSGFIKENDLLKYSEGLILIFSKESIVNNKEPNVCKRYILLYRKYFDRCFYQIDTVVYEGLDYEKQKLLGLKQYFNELCNLVEPILINDCYYLDKRDSNVKRRLNKVAGKSQPVSKSQYYKNLDDSISLLGELFKGEKKYKNGETYYELLVRMIGNTVELANSCSFRIDIGNSKLPTFESGQDNKELFEEIIAEGWELKVQGRADEVVYMARLEREMKVIEDNNFIDYFLILWDVVKWAKNNQILVGNARGSVAGSLVAFLLDITTVDPIRFDLLFERFMNETRFSKERAASQDNLPDIDLDFQSSKRDKIKEYFETKYGSNYTASVGTFTKMRLKGVIKDFGREEHNLNFTYLNYITSMFNDWDELYWEDLFKVAITENNEKLIKFIQENFDLVNDLKCAVNQARAASVHASALLLVPKVFYKGQKLNIFQQVPVRKIKEKGKDVLITEWEGKYVERAGFLKEDILGITQLDKFDMMIKLIKRYKNKVIALDDIPLDDEEVYKIFQKGHNEDVFQFGTHGIKKYSKLVKPDNIEDLIAMNALYRPGPIGSKAHLDYAEIKHGRKKVVYDYGLKIVTEKTYGLFVYQEQIMQATMVLGNLSAAESDTVRTIIKHFLREKMELYEKKFIQGAIKNGCGDLEAAKIWKKLLLFSEYGFNRSHSCAYAIMAYQSQWLKCHYPLEFYTTAFSFGDKDYDIPNIINEINQRKIKIKINPPDINESQYSFSCDPNINTIYWSLISVKGVGEATIKALFAVRKEGKFKSLKDFIDRTAGRGVKKNIVEVLILAGCFDIIENIKDERQRKKLLEEAYKQSNTTFPEKYSESKYNRNYSWILLQKEVAGFGQLNFEEILNAYDRRLSRLYLSAESFLTGKNNFKQGIVVGFLTSIRERKSKRGKFAELVVQNNYETLYVTAWSDIYGENKKQLEKIKKEETLFAVTGKIKYDDYKGFNVLYTDTEHTKIIEL